MRSLRTFLCGALALLTPPALHAQHDQHAHGAHQAPAPVKTGTGAPRTSSEMAAIDPRATLRPDPLDAPAHSAVLEAAKTQPAPAPQQPDPHKDHHE